MCTMSKDASFYRALVCSELSKEIDEGISKLKVVQLPRAPLQNPDDIRVSVKAAAVNFFGTFCSDSIRNNPAIVYRSADAGG